MKTKDRIFAGMVLVGITNLASISAFAAQEIQGEFLTVHSGKIKDSATTLEQIKNEAIEACAGRDYSIDPLLNYYTRDKCFVKDPSELDCGTYATARVFCKN